MTISFQPPQKNSHEECANCKGSKQAPIAGDFMIGDLTFSLCEECGRQATTGATGSRADVVMVRHVAIVGLVHRIVTSGSGFSVLSCDSVFSPTRDIREVLTDFPLTCVVCLAADWRAAFPAPAYVRKPRMTFEEMLEAIQECRLEVMQDARHFWRQPVRGLGDTGPNT